MASELQDTKRPRNSPDDVSILPQTPHKPSLNKYLSEEYSIISDTETSRLATDFEIVDVIRVGSFGTVYRARGLLDNVMYAVKRSQGRFRGASERDEMLHEVQALAELSSKADANNMNNIVRYYGAWIENNHLCIQMELCGSSLDTATFLLGPQQIYNLLRDILQALHFLHSNDFVHLDIKPANILVKSNHYKLSDFGLALHTDHGKAISNVQEGDCRYMAVELLSWGPVADLTKCDIFSAGITTLEIASGVEMPFNGDQWHQLRAGLTREVLPVSDRITDELLDIIKYLMAPNPADRPSAQHCLDSYNVLKSDLEKELFYQKTYAESLRNKLEHMDHNYNHRKPNQLKRSQTFEL